MKKTISIIISICLLFSIVSTIVYAKNDTGVSIGYINTFNMKTGENGAYQGISKNNVIYMLPNDISAIGEYECENLSIEKEYAESIVSNNSLISDLYSKLNLNNLFNDDSFEFLLFSRKDSTTDYITQIYYYDGFAETMNKSFEIDTVDYDGKTYLNLEKMLYLMHAQWCSDESVLYYYPLDYNIFDFIGEKFSYMYESSVQHNSLLYEGESEFGHSARIVLSHVLNDIDMRIFIPFYGSDMIQQDWYEDAILQLATTDDSFINEDGSKKISEYLVDSPYHKIETNLRVADTSLEAIKDLPNKISDSKLNKFSKWNDFSTISIAQLDATQKKLSNFGEAVSVVNVLVDFNEINTRSKGWGNDFINGLNILYEIDEDTYGDYGKHIEKVSDSLLDEFENPTDAAEDVVLLDSYELVLDKMLDDTIIGHIESIITLSNVIIKSNPDYAEQIENADLMNTVHALINVENVFLSEFVDYYHDYLHYLEIEDGCSSLRLWELMYISVDGKPQKEIETHAISEMRNALEMFLKASLRNKTYVYHFNCFNNGDSDWTSTIEAQELKEDIYKTYALLSELISTRDYDNLLYLDESFESMYSDEYGLMRQHLNASILKDKFSPTWVEELTKGYWQSKIETFELYKFNEDGTGKVYGVADMSMIDTTKLDNLDSSYIESFTWELDGDYLCINNYKLKFVSKSDDYDWDMGIYHRLPENEKFFYEVDYVETDAPDNAFYLARYNEENMTICDKVTFDVVNENAKEYAIITGYDKDNKAIWEYKTPEYERAELERVSDIGQKDNKYFIVQGGAIVALDMRTGNPLWTNDEFQGCGTDVVIGNDAIYLCGQYGPDFFAVSFDGVTLCNIRQFDESYYWAQSIELKDNQALVYLHGGDFDYDEPVVFSVVLSSFDFHMVKEVSGGSSTGHQSAEQLRKSIVGSWGLMGDYVFEANGVCYFMGDKNNSGTYKITDDKTLIIDFPWTHNRYIWSDLSFDEFRENHEHDEYFWYFTSDGVLRLNGSEYYRDGLIPID